MREEQLEKAPRFIWVTVSGSETERKEVQFANAFMPISVTPFGKVTETRPLQPAKVFWGIDVMSFSSVISSIFAKSVLSESAAIINKSSLSKVILVGRSSAVSEGEFSSSKTRRYAFLFEVGYQSNAES